MKKQYSFLAGAAILTGTSLMVRVIGFFFRIFLSNTIGAQGMGIYSLIMSVYGLCTTIATSSVSIAVSRLVAEQLSLGNPENAKSVLRRAVKLSFVLGCGVAAILLITSRLVAVNLLGDERTLLSLRILAPGLPFISVSSCFRGYFIAHRQTGNPASGQLLEQLFKVGFIVPLLPRWIPLGLEYACALIVLGLTLGEVICFIYTFVGFLLLKKQNYSRQQSKMHGIMGKILEIILPISIASYVRSSLRLAENVLTMNGLRTFSGGSDSGTTVYGMLKGMAMPLLLFPLNLLSSFVITLTPEVSRLRVAGQGRKLEYTVSMILQYTCYAGILIVCVFMSFSRELGESIYHNTEVGQMLFALSFLSPFMCLEMVVVGILHGLGEQVASTRYSVADCFLRIALVWLLIPVGGITGFLWMTIASNLFTSLLNLRRLVRVTNIRFRVKDWLLKPGFAAAAAGQIVTAISRHNLLRLLDTKVALFAGILFICAFYSLLLLLLGCIKLTDMRLLQRRLYTSTKRPKTSVQKAFD